MRDLFLSALQWKVKVLSNRRVPGNDPSVLVNLRIAVVFNIPPGNRLGRGVIAKTNVRKVWSLPHFLHILPHICILPLLIEKLTLSFSSRNYAKGPTFLSFELKHCVYRLHANIWGFLKFMMPILLSIRWVFRVISEIAISSLDLGLKSLEFLDLWSFFSLSLRKSGKESIDINALHKNNINCKPLRNDFKLNVNNRCPWPFKKDAR